MKEKVIRALQENVLTASEIARSLGVSRQYVHQISVAIGVFAYKKPPRVYLPKPKDPIKAEARVFARVRGLKDPYLKYARHRTGAKRRGIPFLLSFAEWWGLWKPHYDKMGVSKGCMCMCRDLDQGAYEMGNVRIDLVQNNGHERRIANYYKRGPELNRNRRCNQAIQSGFVMVDHGGIFDDPMDIFERNQEMLAYYDELC